MNKSTILERIQNTKQLKRLSYQELEQLCVELRSFIVKSVAKTGGHLASNSTALTSETIFIDINTTAHNLEYDTHIWLHKSTRDNEGIAYKYSSIHVSIYYSNHMKYFTYNFNFRDKQLLADIFNCLLRLDETSYFSQNEVKYANR